jgi:signal transduction histidine kinase
MRETFKKGDEETFERLQLMAQVSSDRILRIVNQLLDISRLESGQLPIEREALPVFPLLREAASRFEILAKEADIHLAVEAPPDLPLLYADRSLMTRVVDNLLDNAIKFTPDGGRVHLTARCSSEPEGDRVVLGVSDNGPGIPPEAQSRLFAKFQQASAGTGRRRGTGLGLAFCKLAVEAHDGRIWVESEVAQGSTFLIELPVANQPVGPEV